MISFSAWATTLTLTRVELTAVGDFPPKALTSLPMRTMAWSPPRPGPGRRYLGFLELPCEAVLALHHADGQGDRNAVHRMDFPDPVEDIKILLHHVCQSLLGNTGHKVGGGVLLDKSVTVGEIGKHPFRHIGEEGRLFHIRHIRRHFRHVIDADNAEYRPGLSAFLHRHFHIRAVHEVENHERRLGAAADIHVDKFVKYPEERSPAWQSNHRFYPIFWKSSAQSPGSGSAPLPGHPSLSSS